MAFRRRPLVFCSLILTILHLATADLEKAQAAKDGYDYYHDWAAKNLPKGGKEVPNDVRGELDDFVAGVKKAWDEEHAAKDHKDVVDLGQSLHLLESKFAKLKDTIFRQYIEGKSGKDGGASGVVIDTSEIEKTTSMLVHKIIAQQGDVGQIQTDVQMLEHTVKTLTDNLKRLEQDIGKATKILGKLDSSQEELRETADRHYDTLTHHGDHIEDMTLVAGTGHTKFYYLIVFEMIALALFAFIRRRNAKKNKFNKMG